MRGIILIILLACVLGIAHTAAGFQITEFCPDPFLPGDADEFLVLSGNGSLGNISISDGEGTIGFPAGSEIPGSVSIARSAKAYRQVHGKFPDYEWLDSAPEVSEVLLSGQFRMANDRDTLVLFRNGSVIQKISWPEDVVAREGQIHYMENGTWDRRVLMIGQSRLKPAVFRNVTVTAFVSPDCSREMYATAITSAADTILINMYEFSSQQMAEPLIDAKDRGVNVSLLVEGGPVGGISASERSVIRLLQGRGIPVLSMVSTQAMHAPYRFDHAKYVVIDNRFVLITSENFGNTGFPPEGISGNRGWGAYLEDPALSSYFTGVFSLDSGSQSVVPYAGTIGTGETLPDQERKGEYAPARFGGATVTPVLSPDTSFLLSDLLESANSTIEIEQAYITNETQFTLNPYLSSAINASRRGVIVRVLLDSYWYNIEDTSDNDEMAALINRIAAAEHLPLEARCADLPVSRIEKIHNKGVIVDDRRVLISSINWNSVSPNFNREAGVIIDHPGAARYFRQVFDEDWHPAAYVNRQGPDYSRFVIVILVIAVLLLVYFSRRGR